jgi:uncharacterized protein DUF3606
VERRSEREERRKANDAPVPSERRFKLRRRPRAFFGSPPAELAQIDGSDADVVGYWARELDVTSDELKSAAQKAGPTVKAVRDYFGK